MPACTSAQLLVNVLALDDVMTSEDFQLANTEDNFSKIVEAAVGKAAEDYYSGHRPNGPDHMDWNGSRLQFWMSYKAKICTILIFQFNYNLRPPLVCCKTQDMVYGERHLIAQYAITGDGRELRIEDLPESDARRPHRTPRPKRSPATPPTLHRLIEKALRLLRRIKEGASSILPDAGIESPSAMLGLSMLSSEANERYEFRPRATNRVNHWIKQFATITWWNKVLAIFGCSSSKCQPLVVKTRGNSGNPLDALKRLVRDYTSTLTPIMTRNILSWKYDVADHEPPKHQEANACIECEFNSHEYRLAMIHGIRPGPQISPSDFTELPSKGNTVRDAERVDVRAANAARHHAPEDR